MLRRKITLSNIVFLFMINIGLWLVYQLISTYPSYQSGDRESSDGPVLDSPKNIHKEGFMDSQHFVRKRGSDTSHVTDICSSAPPLPGIPDEMFFNHLVTNRPLNLVYCFVPKAGCTFWKRAFYYIQNTQENRRIGNLFDVKKGDIHRLRIDKLSKVAPDFASRHMFLNSAKKFILVREPYSRLFSAWVDKLFLPDFWHFIGIPIVRRYRDGAKLKSLQCGHDVTFHEFLQYVLDIGRSMEFTVQQFDDHWLPISRICQTCNVKYDIVGRMEDFAASRDLILTSSGMDRYIPTNISSTETEIDTMKQNIETYWNSRGATPYCVTLEQLLLRLWTSFQFQGFLPAKLPLPLAEIKKKGPLTPSIFLEFVSRVHLEFLKENPHGSKAQRKAAMLDAYNTIPRKLLHKIKELFHFDFALYGYDPEPTEIFH